MTDTSKIDERAEALVLSMIDEGIFEVDALGRVWRLAVKHRGKVTAIERRRAEYPATNGYLRIRVMVNGIRMRVSAHRVVWRYFNGDIPPGLVVDHENRKRWDNRPENLEPVTQSVNTLRAIDRDEAKDRTAASASV